MNNSNLNQQRLFILIAASLGILSVFLPWSSTSVGSNFMEIGELGSQSTNGFSSTWGMLTFLVFAVSIVISITGNKTELLERKLWSIVIAAGGAALLFTVIAMFNKPSIKHPVMDISTSIGTGAWISLIASAGIIASAWYFKKPEDSLADGFESLKNEITSRTSAVAPVNSGVSKEINTMEEIEKLFQMKEKGIITEEDFKTMKQKLMNSN